MANINKNIIMQAGAAVANAANKAAGLPAATPEPGSIISVIQLVNGGRTIGPDTLAHFTESVRNKLLSLLVSMEPIQSGSGTPSPDNVRPISGRTGLNVYVSPTQDQQDATTYAVDWSTQAGTVYSGTLNVVTGELVVDRGCVNISSSWYWNKSSSYPGGFFAEISNIGTRQKKSTPFICSHAKTATSISQYVQGTCYCDASINIRIMDSSDTVQDWKDYINAQSTAGTPIQMCYELDTPVTYQLTGTDIVTLVGDNYIWSDSGDVTIKE